MTSEQTYKPNVSLFDLDQAELEMIEKIEAVFAEPIDELSDPGQTCEQIVDEHLASLAGIQEQLGEKLQGYVRAIRAMRAKGEMLKVEGALYANEATRLSLRAASELDRASFLESRLKQFLERRELTQLEVGTFKLKIVNQGGKLPLILSPTITPFAVAERFQKLIPETIEFDKAEIETALKSGEKLEIELPGEAGGEPVVVQWARYGDRPTKLKIA